MGLRGYCSSALVSFLRTYPLCICCESCKVSDRTFLSRCKLWCNQWKGTCPNYFFILALVMSSTNGDRASLSRSIPVSFRIHIVMCTRVFICTIFCNPEKIEVGQPLLKMWIITMIHRFSCFFSLSFYLSLSLLFNYYVCVYIYTYYKYTYYTFVFMYTWKCWIPPISHHFGFAQAAGKLRGQEFEFGNAAAGAAAEPGDQGGFGRPGSPGSPGSLGTWGRGLKM